jgi:hypothetical protein
MKKLNTGEIVSFYSVNITINITRYTSFILIGLMQFIGATILAGSVYESTTFKIKDMINLTDFNNNYWTISITNNQLIFNPTTSGASRGIIIKNIY